MHAALVCRLFARMEIIMSILVKNVTDDAFVKYGRIISGYEISELLIKMDETPLPDSVIYEPSVDLLEALPIFNIISDSIFGGMPIQIGYCNGHNRFLNGLEYHRTSEINVAVTDMILLLGSQQDISKDFTYDTSNVEAFFVPKGTIIECYATTLHYAPCGYNGNGFKCVVVLPRGTNLEVNSVPSYVKEDELLTARNKWLIAHKDANISGAFVGLIGENISV